MPNNDSLEKNSFDYLNNSKAYRGDEKEMEIDLNKELNKEQISVAKASSANKEKKLDPIKPKAIAKIEVKTNKKQPNPDIPPAISISNPSAKLNSTLSRPKQTKQELSSKNIKPFPRSESQQQASPNSKISALDDETSSKYIPSFKAKLNFKKSDKIVIEAKSKGKSTNFSYKPSSYQDVGLKRVVGGNNNYMSASSNKIDKSTTIPDFNKMSFRNTFSSSPVVSPPKQKKQTLLSL